MHSRGTRVQPGATPGEGSILWPCAKVAMRQHRNRASAQAGFISQLRRGQHSGLRPFRLLAAAAGFLCKKVAPGQHRREAPFVFARVVQQKRHDVENVASAGANPAASTTFLELKPQQTGTGLLIRYGEVATTSGSTNFCLVV